MPQSPWKTHLLPPWCPRLNPAFFLKGETNTIWKIYLKLKIIEKILICLVSMSHQLITFNFSTFPRWRVSWELNLNVFWVTTFILNSLKKDKSFKNNINPISHFVPVPFIATTHYVHSSHHSCEVQQVSRFNPNHLKDNAQCQISNQSYVPSNLLQLPMVHKLCFKAKLEVLL